MKTIEQHEADRTRRLLVQRRGPVLCGIECPTCGEELSTDADMQLQTLPPRKRVHCFKCNWSGSVTV